MNELHELAARIRTTNDANGFDAPDWDRLLNKLMLAVTELHEAVEAVQGTGPDPLAEELADTAIRLVDILVAVWPGDWHDRRKPAPQVRPRPETCLCFDPIQVVLWKPLGMVCAAAESWRYDKRDDTRTAIELALRELFSLADRLGIDLMAEMERKVRRNAERGFRHGKVRGDG